MDNARPATTVKEVLIATKWILEEVGWCSGTMYQDKLGNHISPVIVLNHAWDTKATQVVKPCAVCLSGAIQLVVTDPPHTPSGRSFLQKDTFDHLLKLPSFPSMLCCLADFNDTHTKEEVLALVNEGIATA